MPAGSSWDGSSPPAKPVAMNDKFLQHIANHISNNLPKHARRAKIRNYATKNSVRLYYPEFDSSHYELLLTSKTIEIAFSFTGGKTKNAARLALFETHLPALQQRLGYQLVVDSAWQTNWARVVIILPKNSLTLEQAGQYADLMLNFLDLTYPTLCSLFETIPARSSSPLKSPPRLDPKHYGPYTILSRHINQIQAFLRGQAGRPTDEMLCDWVYFCYTFQLYQEGADIFDRIDPAVVQPWLYDRARRLAKVCRLQIKRD